MDGKQDVEKQKLDDGKIDPKQGMIIYNFFIFFTAIELDIWWFNYFVAVFS
jgi:hypothetical protein